jgi:hypothetical protein
MTRDHSNPRVVNLAGRDWIGIITIAITLLVLIATTYLRHDRLIVEVLTRQQTITDRLERMETQMDNTLDRRDE